MIRPDASSSPVPSPDEPPAAASASATPAGHPAALLDQQRRTADEYAAAITSGEHPDPATIAAWGNALFEIGRLSPDLPEKLAHFHQAAEKYATATGLKRNEPAYPAGWTRAVMRMARLLDPAEHPALYLREAEVLARAIQLRPGQAEFLHQTASALSRIAAATKDKPGQILLHELAREKYTAATELTPDTATYHFFLGTTLAHLADLSPPADTAARAALHRLAAASFSRADTLRPTHAVYLYFWAIALTDLAEFAASPPEKIALYREAATKWAAAAASQPADAGYFHGWGNVLALLADELTDDDERLPLYQQALEKLQTALQLNPALTRSQFKAGLVLADLGDLEPDPAQSSSYYLRACEHFRTTLQLDPEWTSAHEYLGITLRDLGNLAATYDEQLRHFTEGSDHFRAITTLKPRKARHFTNWGMLLHDHGEATTDEAAQLALFREAAEKFTRALDLDPTLHRPRHGLANALLDMAHLSEAAESLPLLDAAIRHFAAALDDSSCRHQVLLHWADALCDRGTLLADDPAAAIPSLRESIAKYAEAAVVKPTSYYTYFNWGDALLELYYRIPADPEEETSLLVAACAKFTRAHHLHPDWSGAPARIALASEMLARRVDDAPEKIRLYRRAARYWEMLTLLEPLDASHFQNWGSCLRQQAGSVLEEGHTAERDRLLIRAGNLYATALKLDPRFHSAAVKWAGVLMDRADDLYDISGRQLLLARARRKIQRAIAAGYARGHYHLARLEARTGDLAATLASLDRWQRHDPTASRHWVATSPDFDILKGHPTFEAFLEGLP